MPLPSQSRNQRWPGGSGGNIPKPKQRRADAAEFFIKRDKILTRDRYTCQVCGNAGNLVDLKRDRCVCRRCV